MEHPLATNATIATQPLNYMEATCLVNVEPYFLVATDRLMIRLAYTVDGRNVQVKGQEIDWLIDKPTALDGILAFADQERVHTFLAQLPNA